MARHCRIGCWPRVYSTNHFFYSVDFAVEDFSKLRYELSLAIQYNLGNTISLVPQLENPKDLFKLALRS